GAGRHGEDAELPGPADHRMDPVVLADPAQPDRRRPAASDLPPALVGAAARTRRRRPARLDRRRTGPGARPRGTGGLRAPFRGDSPPARAATRGVHFAGT